MNIIMYSFYCIVQSVQFFFNIFYCMIWYRFEISGGIGDECFVNSNFDIVYYIVEFCSQVISVIKNVIDSFGGFGVGDYCC